MHPVIRFERLGQAETQSQPLCSERCKRAFAHAIAILSSTVINRQRCMTRCLRIARRGVMTRSGLPVRQYALRLIHSYLHFSVILLMNLFFTLRRIILVYATGSYTWYTCLLCLLL
ncbi:hypothetical protein FPV67DRAFT_164040 [Lyophyllum atratum]|nr:hypothetical protein FPV67DRAFT_164040 [Lyophyllum atratum]